MPKRDWSNGVATGLTIGLGLFVLIFVLSSYLISEVNCQKYGQSGDAGSSNEQGKQESCNPPEWWGITQRLVSSEDTLAQWIVAFLSLASVIVSGAALYWVKETLKATREMAVDARRIGDAQVKVANDANALLTKQFTLGFKPQLVWRLGGPYLANPNDINRFSDGEQPRWVRIVVSVAVANSGKPSAIITKFFIGTVEGEKYGIGGYGPQDAFEYLHSEVVAVLNQNFGKGIDAIHLPPEATLAIAGAFYLKAESRDEFIRDMPHVFGWIEYNDAINVKRRMGFGLEPVGSGGDVRRWGGDQYNYDREI